MKHNIAEAGEELVGATVKNQRGTAVGPTVGPRVTSRSTMLSVPYLACGSLGVFVLGQRRLTLITYGNPLFVCWVLFAAL